MQLKDNRLLTRHGFGVHSPWAYDLIEFTINEKLPYYAYDDLYKYWEKAPDFLPQYPQSRDELLFRITNRFNPKFILEAGTGAGVSTGYLASVSKKSRVITVDHTHPANKAVRKNMKQFANIEYVDSANVPESIQEIIREYGAPDMVHVAHTSQWKQIVAELIPVMKPDGVIVIQDLGKKEKKEWWKSIIQDERIGVTFQMSKVGLLFFDTRKHKQHYVL